ncbi:MAG TPA: carboxylating nicotinate-nucleotide diphosphorylase [Polyangiaceae bacterium]|nr:carboxylating nicotinate-nucleotide diphosphorylase [Polyangiaceae bacterium]
MTAPLGALLDALITRALEEDLAGGDLSTDAVIGRDQRAVARAIAKAPLVLCGADVFARVFYTVDPGLRVERFVDDGERCAPGTPLLAVEGAARSILLGERTALNFLQRLCGIATLTRAYVDAIPAGTRLRITDTRKTTPGLRALERWAVRVGGAHNHRNDLGSAVLLKDNHIAAAGGVKRAIELARERAPHTSRIEVEVASLAMLDAALEAGADIVMLDNLQGDALREGVRRASGRALVEVSGGVTLDRIPELARLGVDVVSVGALTHSAPAADVSLVLETLGG